MQVCLRNHTLRRILRTGLYFSAQAGKCDPPDWITCRSPYAEGSYAMQRYDPFVHVETSCQGPILTQGAILFLAASVMTGDSRSVSICSISSLSGLSACKRLTIVLNASGGVWTVRNPSIVARKDSEI